MKSMWLKVEEHLPELKPHLDMFDVMISQYVLVFSQGSKYIAYYRYDEDYNEFSWVSFGEGYEITGVTHWQYLPEDPVE